MTKLAWISGINGRYTLNIAATPATVDFAPLCGTVFAKFRAAQTIANAINAALATR